MKVKTSELSGMQLDWAVARVEGWEVEFENQPFREGLFFLSSYFQDGKPCSPSTDWAQGGPIIEREGIALEKYRDYWVANPTRDPTAHGQTPLIAAMRCYVASKLGDEMEVPDARP
jgi:hypothetical protein